MARTPSKDKFLAKIPEQFHSILRNEDDFKFISTMWKLDDAQLKGLFASLPEKIKPVFDWRLNKTAAKRGNRSNLPYDAEEIKLAADLMKCSPGAVVVAEEGLRGTLLTVQVLAKLEVDGKIKTVSITGIERIESKK